MQALSQKIYDFLLEQLWKTKMKKMRNNSNASSVTENLQPLTRRNTASNVADAK